MDLTCGAHVSVLSLFSSRLSLISFTGGVAHAHLQRLPHAHGAERPCSGYRAPAGAELARGESGGGARLQRLPPVGGRSDSGARLSRPRRLLSGVEERRSTPAAASAHPLGVWSDCWRRQPSVEKKRREKIGGPDMWAPHIRSVSIPSQQPRSVV
jgi:hypothetical protein